MGGYPHTLVLPEADGQTTKGGGRHRIHPIPDRLPVCNRHFPVRVRHPGRKL